MLYARHRLFARARSVEPVRRSVTPQPLFAGQNTITNPAVSAPINMEMRAIDPPGEPSSAVVRFIPTCPSYLVSSELLECQYNDSLMMLGNKVSSPASPISR